MELKDYLIDYIKLDLQNDSMERRESLKVSVNVINRNDYMYDFVWIKLIEYAYE